jgi:hypothetical protein
VRLQWRTHLYSITLLELPATWTSQVLFVMLFDGTPNDDISDDADPFAPFSHISPFDVKILRHWNLIMFTSNLQFGAQGISSLCAAVCTLVEKTNFSHLYLINSNCSAQTSWNSNTGWHNQCSSW